MEHNPQRLIVKGLVLQDNKILLVKRKRIGHHLDGKWEMPGGKVDFNERMEDACVREIQEEAGVICEFEKFAINYYESRLFDAKDYTAHLIIIPLICKFIREDKNYKGDHNVYDVSWFSKDEIKSLKLFEDNKSIIKSVLDWNI